MRRRTISPRRLIRSSHSATISAPVECAQMSTSAAAESCVIKSSARSSSAS
jgi:hypothetical protein